jgi:hypothetical protein
MAEAEGELSRRTARKVARQEVSMSSKKRRDSAISFFIGDTNGTSAALTNVIMDNPERISTLEPTHPIMPNL